ncbi:putative alcohol dehydrogenase protein [Phaeoacremonium minimum UCRPA7]|uniref:Putative alcohol dehydrogenase protein n=1 Tax=Phaeoacremonium minimum (strain UCR-PA7) TaxID=1286976 RepID=R8BPA5_PHAM7|nr:putative alcohol dehydrogenase protein [Phaeoacremonium minimum UCRPA7]EOO01172.1 putative alcohol dehydrogenase protein [Phaeoacremonium minimum UCRPA7]
MAASLPPQHRALVLESIEAGFHVKAVPTPQPGLGSAIVRVAAAGILSYQREVYNGARHYSFPTPLVAGLNAIGRVVAVGPDATALTPGQLVYVDCVVRGRDEPANLFLAAINDGMTDGSKRLMRDVWRDGTFAEYARVPLENCVVLDEARLCGSLGYSIEDLMYMSYLLVPYGGLRDIGLEPGETVLICPATGGYGGAGVQVAIAMGARVIAMGRNEKELARLKEHVKRGSPNAEIETLKLTGDETADTEALQAFGKLDAVLDLTPPQGSQSSHVRSAVRALRRGGRISIMGFIDQPYPPWTFVGKNIALKGKLMYERDDMLQFVKMLERGLFPRGKDFVDTKAFGLEDWKEGLDQGAEHMGIGKHCVFVP